MSRATSGQPLSSPPAVQPAPGHGFLVLRVVPQYGPEWVAHVTSGGAAMRGNTLVVAESD